MVRRAGDTYNKRRFVKIRGLILESLKRFPNNTDGVSKDIHCAFNTAKSHLEYLEQVGVIKKAEFKIRDKDKWLWMVR